MHLGGSFVTRQLTMLLVIAILVYLLADGTRTLLDQDPSLRGAKRQGFLRTWWRLGKQGLLPNLARTFRDVARYFNPWYHPEHEANTQEALEYLANSPAAGARRTPENNSLEIPASAAEAGTFPALVHCYVRSSQTRPADGR